MVMFALGFSLLTALGVGVWCVIVTHRMCGPLFVLENHLVELSRGRFPIFRPLRKKDEFKELYAAFSRVVGSLKDRKQSNLDLLNEALATARSAMNSEGNTRTETLESLVKQINSLRDAAAEALGQEVDSLPALSAVKSPVDEAMPAGII
jgi:nitrogen fixation/metabolism regulation signal transduction histidine kinase